MHEISPGYFRTLGIPLLRGRDFNAGGHSARYARGCAPSARSYEAGTFGSLTPQETNGMVLPAVINESMAKFFWKGRDPLGQMFSWGSVNGPWSQVIGVVGDVRERGLTERPVPEAYSPFDGDSRVFLVLHTSLPPESLDGSGAAELAEVDSSLPLFSVRTMDEVIGEQAQGQQFLSVLVASFAGLAVLLAAIGIYGVLSYAVTARTREIGIRMSLGATQAGVLAKVLGEGMRLALVGFVIGAAGAFAAGRVLASVLHEVKPGDPAVFTATAGVLAAVALAACYLPARRAARLDPMAALRDE